MGYLQPADASRLKESARGAAEGIVAGVTGGAVVGGVLAAAAVALVPGVGPAIVGGALLPVIVGAVSGGAVGGEMGGLIGATLDSEEEPYFMEEVQAGRSLVTVTTSGREEEAAAVLREHRALEVDSLGAASVHTRLRRTLGSKQVPANLGEA